MAQRRPGRVRSRTGKFADGLNLYNAYMGVNGTDPLGLEMSKDFVEHWKNKPYVPDDKRIKCLGDLLSFKEGALVLHMYMESGSMAIQTYSQNGREIADSLDRAIYDKRKDTIFIDSHGLTAKQYREFFEDVKKLKWYKESLKATTVRALDYTLQLTLFLATGGEAQVAELLGMTSVKVFPQLAAKQAMKYGAAQFSDDFVRYTNSAIHLTDEAGKAGIESSGFLNGRYSGWALEKTQLPETTFGRVSKTFVKPSRTTHTVEVNPSGLIKPKIRSPLSYVQNKTGILRTPGPGAYNIQTGEFYYGQLYDATTGGLRQMTQKELFKGHAHDYLLDGIGWSVPTIAAGTSYVLYDNWQTEDEMSGN